MLLTIAIVIAVLAGYALGFRTSRPYHRRQYAKLIEQRILASREE